MKTLCLLLLLLPLAACGSIDGRIADLREDEQELLSEIEVLTNERKRLNALVTALQLYKADDSSENARRVEDAERDYDRAVAATSAH